MLSNERMKLTFRAGDGLDLFGMGANIIDDGSFEVGYLYVPSLTHNVVLNSRKLVEFECTVTRLN